MGTENQNVFQTTTQTVKEDPKFAKYRQALLDETVDLVQSRAQTPVLPPAYYVAGLSPQEEQATALGQSGIGGYLPYLQSAQGILGEGARAYGQALGRILPAEGTTPALQQGIASIQQAQQAQFDPASVSQFQNPYQEYVAGAINRQFDKALNQQQAQATSMGALSGTRRDILEGELEGQRARAIGEAYAQDYGRASQQAQNVFGEEQTRRLNAGQALGNIGFGVAGGIAGLGTQLSGLSGLQAGLGQQAQASNVQDINTLLNLGTLQRGLAQSTLDAQRQRELDIQRYPYQQLQFLSDIYKGIPSTQQTITQAPTYSPSPFQQAAGLGIAGIAATSGGGKGLFG